MTLWLALYIGGGALGALLVSYADALSGALMGRRNWRWRLMIGVGLLWPLVLGYVIVAWLYDTLGDWLGVEG